MNPHSTLRTFALAIATLALASTACTGELATDMNPATQSPESAEQDDAPDRDREEPRFRGDIPSADECEATDVAPGPALDRRLTNWEFAHTIEDVFDIDVRSDVDDSFDADLRTEGFTNTSTTLIVNLQRVQSYESMAEAIVSRIDNFGDFVEQHASCSELETECQESFTRSIGETLFRRPLNDEEVSNFEPIFEAVSEEGDGFEIAAQLVVEAMLQSPQFLYRLEVQEDEVRSLNGYEMASRLSYLVWDSAPDTELMRAAEAGELETPEGIETQVRRLLDDPRSMRASERFVRDWLALDRLEDFDRDEELYPEYNRDLGRAMLAETVAVAQKVLREDNRPISDLLRTRTTLVDRELAEFYGFADPRDGVNEYDLSEHPERRGILTHAGVLANAGGGNEPSLVERGLFLLNNVMCETVAAPSLDIAIEFMPSEPGKTQRTYSEERMAQTSCAGCHSQFDPLGYGLEQFDGVGMRMTHDLSGNELETHGYFYDFAERTDKEYTDVDDYMQALADSSTVQDCLIKKPVQRALGRSLVANDACLLADVKSRYLESGATYDELIVAIATNPNFRHIEPR